MRRTSNWPRLLNRPEILLPIERAPGRIPAPASTSAKRCAISRPAASTILLTTHLMDRSRPLSRLAIMTPGNSSTATRPAAMKERHRRRRDHISSADTAGLKSKLHEKLGVFAEEIDDRLRLERPARARILTTAHRSRPGNG